MPALDQEMAGQRVNAPGPDTGNEVPMPEQAYPETKRCRMCGGTFPLEAFPRGKNGAQGRGSYCRECSAAYQRARQDGWTEEQRAQKRERNREYRARNKDKIRKTARKRAAQINIEHKAHAIVLKAVRDGTLIRPDLCSECGRDAPLEGHHDDYDKPLEVDWLCHRCHRIRHTRSHLRRTET